MFNIHVTIILNRSIFHALDKYPIHQIQLRVLLKIFPDATNDGDTSGVSSWASNRSRYSSVCLSLRLNLRTILDTATINCWFFCVTSCLRCLGLRAFFGAGMWALRGDFICVSWLLHGFGSSYLVSTCLYVFGQLWPHVVVDVPPSKFLRVFLCFSVRKRKQIPK